MANKVFRAIFKGLQRFYSWLYRLLCGTHFSPRPWHYRWCAVRGLHADLRESLPLLEGRVLLVGAHSIQYTGWATRAAEFVAVRQDYGADARPPGNGISHVPVHPHQPWPLPTASFDALLCTQALATMPDPNHVAAEMARLLRPGGLAVVSAPTLIAAGETTLASYSAEGLRRLLDTHFTVTAVRREGGIGSSLVLMILVWLEAAAAQRALLRLAQLLFLPLWITLCGTLNMAAVLLDAVDTTRVVYANTLVVGVHNTDADLLRHASQ
jgi:SAM-dependent methyltransferase